MISEQLQEQAALYAVGALSPDEAHAFELELARNPELRQLFEQFQDATAALALNAPTAAPSANLKERILAATATSETEKIVRMPDRTRRSPFAMFLPWALAASFAAVAFGLLSRNANLRMQLDELAAKNGASHQQIAALETALDDLKAKDKLSQVRIAMLGSLLENSPKAIAVSVWDDEKQDGVLVVENLAPLPADKDYQLWVVDPQQAKPVDGGVFSVDTQGKVRIHFKPKGPVGSVKTFAVSLERKGGVPVAEGPMVLAGDLL